MDSWSSDVTDWLKTDSNRGRTVAAGVMTGVPIVIGMVQKPQSGSGA
jgi:hypothetical protein